MSSEDKYPDKSHRLWLNITNCFPAHFLQDLCLPSGADKSHKSVQTKVTSDNRFECIGCAFKVPDPRKRKQVEEKRQWAEERLLYYEQEGLVLEVEKLKSLIRACVEELEEMYLMEGYRKDASKEAIISLE